MNTKIQKIGNSEGIIIPKDVLDRMGLKVGDDISLTEEDGRLILNPEDADLTRQLEHAERFMERYKVTLQKLAE
jgi:putative addiction module antidote